MKKYKKSIISALVFLLSMTLYSCSNSPVDLTATPLPTEVMSSPSAITHYDLGFNTKIEMKGSIEDYLPMAVPGEGLGLALYDEEGNPISEDTLYTNEKLQFFLTLYSYIPSKVSYKLIEFIDFEQTPISVDGNNYDNGFDFTMPPNSSADIPLSVNISQEGLHEILFVFVVSSKNKSLERDYRFNTEISNLQMCRIFISVKSNKSIPIPVIYNDLQNTEIIESSQNFLMITKSKDKLIPWLSETVRPSAEIQCYLHIGSGHEKEKRKYAVMLLNEWRQVEITDSKKVLFIELDPDKEIIIPTTLSMLAQEGVYDVTPILIFNPYNDYLPKSTRTSFRTGIQVSANAK